MPVQLSNATLSEKIGKSLKNKWLSIVIFLAIFGFFIWQIYVNAAGLLSTYLEYRKNIGIVNMQKAKMHPQSLTDDNEVYNNPAPDTSIPQSSSNDAIKKRISDIKTEHTEYNRALNKDKPGSGDVVDEKIISSQYDDY